MDLMTAQHNLLFMTDDELIALEQAIEDEQQRRREERRKDYRETAMYRMSADAVSAGGATTGAE